MKQFSLGKMQAASSCIKCSAPLIINGDVEEDFDVDEFGSGIIDSFVVLDKNKRQQSGQGQDYQAAGRNFASEYDYAIFVEKILEVANDRYEIDHPLCSYCLNQVVEEKNLIDGTKILSYTARCTKI